MVLISTRLPGAQVKEQSKLKGARGKRPYQYKVFLAISCDGEIGVVARLLPLGSAH